MSLLKRIFLKHSRSIKAAKVIVFLQMTYLSVNGSPIIISAPKIGLNTGEFAMRDDSYLDRGNYSDFMSMRLGIVGKLGITDRISTQL